MTKNTPHTILVTGTVHLVCPLGWLSMTVRLSLGEEHHCPQLKELDITILQGVSSFMMGQPWKCGLLVPKRNGA